MTKNNLEGFQKTLEFLPISLQEKPHLRTFGKVCRMIICGFDLFMLLCVIVLFQPSVIVCSTLACDNKPC